MIQVGDRIPQLTLMHMTDGGPAEITTDEIFAGKRVVLFALPGAYTPTCSAAHLPGFVVHGPTLLEKNVDAIVCLSVNDPFVMGAWGRDQNVDAIVRMVADGNGDFTRAVGMEEDRRDKGMGMRSKRYSMLVEDGVVSRLNLEQPGAFEVSSAEVMLEQLG